MATSAEQLTFADGLKNRDAGQSKAASRLSVGEVEAIRAFVAGLIRRATPFSTDDVHSLCGPELAARLTEHPNALGGIFRALALEGSIEQLREAPVRSLRPEARGRKIPLWRKRYADG